MRTGDPASFWHLTGPLMTGGDSLPERSDIVVVGGGLAGLVTALLLARRGREVTLIEAAELGGRTTSRTTGKASLLQGAVASQVRRHAGDEVLAAYLDANAAGALWLSGELASSPEAWDPRTAYTYATTPQGERSVRQEAEAMAAGGRPVDLLEGSDATAIGLPPVEGVTAALRMPQQAQLHPVHAAAVLLERLRAAGGRVVDGCRVQGAKAAADCVELDTERGRIVADRAVIATGTPILDRSLLFGALKPHRQAVVAFRLPPGATPPEGMYLSVDPTSRSVRTATDTDGAPVLVVGGGDMVTGRGDRIGALRDGILEWTADRYPSAQPITWWAAQDYQMTTQIPFAGAVAGGRGRIFAMTGFAKWGMTNAPAAALAVDAELHGEELAWHERLRAHRPGLRDAAATAALNAETGALMLAGWVAPRAVNEPPADVPARTRRHLGEHGMRPVAEARIDGRVCRVSAVCTHLGGIVRWNDAERSWDCPLHGSRFTADGRVIEGPATTDLPTLR